MNDPYGAYGDPPPVKEVFDSSEEEIDYLFDQALYWYWRSESDLPKARYYADRLATLLDDPTLKDQLGRYRKNTELWALVWDARGNIEEAIRYADMTVNEYKEDLAYCDDSDYNEDWFREDIEALQDGLFLQAKRHLRLNDREKAQQRMIEAFNLSKQYGVLLDNDGLALLQELME